MNRPRVFWDWNATFWIGSRSDTLSLKQTPKNIYTIFHHFLRFLQKQTNLPKLRQPRNETERCSVQEVTFRKFPNGNGKIYIFHGPMGFSIFQLVIRSCRFPVKAITQNHPCMVCFPVRLAHLDGCKTQKCSRHNAKKLSFHLDFFHAARPWGR